MTKETKMAGGSKAAEADLMAAFEAYRQANDARLAEIEARGASDPLTDERLARIDRRLEALSLKMARPEAGTAPAPEPDPRMEAWTRYLRTGDESGLARLDVKALNTGTESQGGYVAPPELDRLIEARLMAASPMRQIATVRQTSAGTYRKPVSLGAAASWVAETDARTETAHAGLSLLEFPAGELYAMPAATQALLEDAWADIDAWLADEVENAFAAQESAAFVTGDGTSKPRGFLDYEIVPEASHVWGDGGNWARGHWLNGRAGLAPLAGVVADICARGGVAGVDASALDGVVQGYALEGVYSVRNALEPLKAAFGFEAVERDGQIVFRMEGEGALHQLDGAQVGEAGIVRTRRLVDKAPQRLRLEYVDGGADFGPALAEARKAEGDVRLVADASLPLALSSAEAEAIAARLLAQAANAETAEVTLPLAALAIEPGDAVRFEDGPAWRVDGVTDRGAVRVLSLKAEVAAAARMRSGGTGGVPDPAPVPGGLDLVLIDGPRLPGEAVGLRVAAWADPWPGEVRVRAGTDESALSERAVLTRPAVIGRLVEGTGAGPTGRWDRANRLRVATPGSFASLPAGQVLSGGNALLLETVEGWELVQFTTATLAGPEEWVLSGLLRGQQGSVSAPAPAGARVLLLDGSDALAAVAPGEIGAELTWRAAGTDAPVMLAFADAGGRPWPVGHLRESGGQLGWVRRGADLPESWALPEGANAGRFAVAFDLGGGFGAAATVDGPSAAVPDGAIAARVAEIGADGRMGKWVSIGLGTP